MKNKKWYEIFGDGQTEKSILLAKVNSKGLAYILAEKCKEMYTNITIK